MVPAKDVKIDPDNYRKEWGKNSCISKFDVPRLHTLYDWVRTHMDEKPFQIDNILAELRRKKQVWKAKFSA